MENQKARGLTPADLRCDLAILRRELEGGKVDPSAFMEPLNDGGSFMEPLNDGGSFKDPLQFCLEHNLSGAAVLLVAHGVPFPFGTLESLALSAARTCDDRAVPQGKMDGLFAVAEAMVSDGADNPLEAPLTPDGQTLLHLLAASGDVQHLVRALKSGADPDVVDNDGVAARALRRLCRARPGTGGSR